MARRGSMGLRARAGWRRVFRRLGRRSPERARGGPGAPRFESLEPRLLLSGSVTAVSEEPAPTAAAAAGSPDRPALVVPGMAGTLWAQGEKDAWLTERGIAPSKLRTDPLLGSLDDMTRTLENVGYTEGEDLFVADHEWRVSPAPEDGTIDGVVSGLTAESLTDETYGHGVDYLGHWLDEARAAWQSAHGSAPDSVDVIAHGTGGLVARAYLQSGSAYGGDYTDDAGATHTLPEIENLVMVGVPNRGASKAWNPLQNNFSTDLAFRVVLSKVVEQAYERVTDGGATIAGPDGSIEAGDYANREEAAARAAFVEDYVPTLRDLLATYPFLVEDPAAGSAPLTVNDDPASRNGLLLDLNAGLDADFFLSDGSSTGFVDAAGNETDPATGPNAFVREVRGDTVVAYSDALETPTLVNEREGPVTGQVDLISGFSELVGEPPGRDEIWYEDRPRSVGEPEQGAPGSPGDETVPLRSARGQFEGDARFTRVRVTDPGFGHGVLTAAPAAQRAALAAFGFTEGVDFTDADLSTDRFTSVDEEPFAMAANLLSTNVLGTDELLTAASVVDVLRGDLDDVLAAAQAKQKAETAFKDLLAAGGSWLANKVAGTAPLSEPLPLLGESVGDLIAIDGVVNDLLFEEATGLGSALLGEIGAKRVDDLAEDLGVALDNAASGVETAVHGARTFGGLLPGGAIAGGPTTDQIRFNAGFTIQDTVARSISLPGAAGEEGVRLGELELAVDAALHVDLTLGYLLDDGLPEKDRVFLRVQDLSADVDVAATNISPSMRFGFLGASVENGSVRLDGDLDVELENPDGDAAGRVTRRELENTAASGLINVTAVGALDADLPVSASLGSFQADDAAKVRVTDDALFAGPPAELHLENVAELLPFGNANASGLFGVLGGVRDAFKQLSGSGVLDTEVPFAKDTTLGDVLSFGDGVRGAVIEPLSEVVQTEDPDGNERETRRAAFETAQQLGTRLASALGADSSAVGLDYDPQSRELTFDLPISTSLETSEASFRFDADAGALGRLSAGGTVSLDASIDTGLTVGARLTPVRAVITAGSALPSDGQLSGDATFDLSIGGGAAVSVAVAADGSNTRREDLIADVRQGLADAGIGDKVEARLDDNDRLELFTAGAGTTPRLTLATNAGDPAVTELGFSTMQADADSFSERAFIEDASLTGSLTLTADDLNATGRFGFLRIEADGASASVDAVAEISLVDPDTGTTGGRIALPKAFDRLANAPRDLVTDANGDSTLDLRSSSSDAPVASATIPVRMSPNLLGADHPANPQITLDWADVTDPSALSLSFNSDMDRLLDYERLDYQSVLTALAEAADFLRDRLDRGNFLSEDLPLLGNSVTELLGFAEDFAGRVERASDESVTTLGSLERTIESAFNLSDDAVALTLADDLLELELDVSRDFTPAAFDGPPEDANGNGVLDDGEDRDGDGVLDRWDARLSFDLAEAVANAGGSSNLDVSGASDFVDVSGSGGFSFEGRFNLDLDLGIDLSDRLNPIPIVFDSSSVNLEAKAEGTDLDTSVSLGPLGVFVRNGTARLDDGTNAHNPATIGASFNDAPDDPTLPAGAYKLASVGAGDVSLTAQAAASADLPLFFPTENDALSPSLTLSIDDLLDPASTTSISGPDLASEVGDLDLTSNLGALLDGLDMLLGEIQSALSNDVFSNRFPLVGDQLADAGDFVEQIRSGVLADLRAASDGGVSGIQSALFDALGPSGLDWLGDTDGDTDIDADDIVIAPANPDASTDEIAFDILLNPSVSVLDESLGLELGLPALGLDVSGDIQADLGFTWNLGFGVSREKGVFFDTTMQDELTAGLDVTLPDASATGTLGFLQVDVEDRESDPTSFGLDFAVDLLDPNGDDGRLTIAELTSGAGSILDASASGGADVNLDLVTSFGGSAQFPSLEAGLNLDWMFDTGDLSGSEPSVSFSDVQLDAGEFLSDLAGPVLERIQRITGPLQPIVDALNTTIPVIDEKLIDLAVNAIPGVDAEVNASGFLDALDAVIDLANSVPAVDGEVMLDLGSFDLTPEDEDGNAQDLRELGSLGELDLQQDLLANLPSTGPLSQLKNIAGDVAGFIDDTKSPGGTSNGFAFPLLEQPQQAFGLLLGQDVDLVTYDMAPLDFAMDFTLPLPPIPLGPVSVRFELGGGVGAGIDLGFGYDTSGFRLFSQTDDPADLAAGFYVSDRENADGTGADVAEAELRGSLFAGAAVGIGGVADVGVRGTLETTLGADLRDGDGDGRVHVNEFVSHAEHGLKCTFDLVGSVDFMLDITASLLGGVGGTLSKEVVDTTIAEFSVSAEDCFTGRFEPNNTRAEAANLGPAPGIHVEGATINAGSDHDWLRFELPERDSVDVELAFDHSDADVNLEVYDDENTLLGRSASTNDDETVTLTDADPGTYYAHVSGTAANDYDLSVEPAAASSTRVLYVNAAGSGYDNADDEGFYALAAGDDANDGRSPSAPKRSLQGLVDAVDLGADDVVVLERGAYDGVSVAGSDSGASWYGAVTGSTLEAGRGPAVTLDGVSGNLFHQLTLAGDTGALLTGAAADNTLRALRVPATTGVRIEESASGNALHDNTFTGATGLAIAAHGDGPDPADNVVEANAFEGVGDGVVLESTAAQTIRNNAFESPGRGVVARPDTQATVEANTVTGATTGIEIEAGAAVTLRGNEIESSGLGIANDSRAATLAGNTLRDNTTGLTGLGHLGAPSAAEANEIVGGTTGIEIPANGDGQLVAHNEIRETGTGILDERAGGAFAAEMPLLLPGRAVDEAGLPAHLERLTSGDTFAASGTVVALPVDPFAADNAELGAEIRSFLDSGSALDLGPRQGDATLPRASFYADELFPANGDPIARLSADRFVEIPAERFFDRASFSSAVRDQLPERDASAPLRVEDADLFVDRSFINDDLGRARIVFDAERYFGASEPTLSGTAIRGPRPARVVDNEIVGGDVGIDTASTVGADDWSRPNVVRDNATGVDAGPRAEIRYTRLLDNDTAIASAVANRLHHNVIRTSAADGAAGIVSSGSGEFREELVVRHNTIDQRGGGAGIEIGGRPSNATIRHNILHARDGHALAVDPVPNVFWNRFESDYNNLYATADGGLVEWERSFDDLLDWRIASGFDAHSIGLTAPDPGRDAPGFADPVNGDYRLESGSTSIDAGDPAADARGEGPDGGGRVNLGAYGGTGEAAASPSASLRVESPRLYTDWPRERTGFLEWHAQGVSGDVAVDLVDKASGDLVREIARVPAGAGSARFTPAEAGLPADSSRAYRVRVRSVDQPSVTATSPEWLVVPSETDTYYVDDGSNDGDALTPGAVGDARNPGTAAEAPKASLFGLLDAGRTGLREIGGPSPEDAIEHVEPPEGPIGFDERTTADPTPRLTGYVADPNARVTVTVAGQGPLAATNRGDQTWFLDPAKLSPLSAGAHDVTVRTAAGDAVTAEDGLTVEASEDFLTIDRVKTADRSPTLTGTVADPSWAVTVSYGPLELSRAEVAPDGSWTLSGDRIGAVGGSPSDALVRAKPLGGPALGAGDTVRVDAGEHTLLRTPIIDLRHDGMTLAGAGDEPGPGSTTLDRAFLPTILSRDGDQFEGGAFQAALQVDDADGVTIEGLRLKRAGSLILSRGNDAGNESRHLTIRDNTLLVVNEPEESHFTQRAIHLASGARNSLVENNRIVPGAESESRGSIGDKAIEVTAPGTLVTGNTIADVGGIGIDGINRGGIRIVDNTIRNVRIGIDASSEDLLVKDNHVLDVEEVGIRSNNAQIVGNTVHDAPHAIGDPSFGASGQIRNNVLFDADVGINFDFGEAIGNRVYDHREAGIRYVGGSSFEIRDNRVYDATVGLDVDGASERDAQDTGRVAGNVVYANETSGIRLATDHMPVDVFNNTVFQPAGKGIVVEESAAPRLRNNIVSAAGDAAVVVDGSATGTFDGDRTLFHVTGSAVLGRWDGAEKATLGDWRSTTGGGGASLTGDPGFADPDGADDRLGFDALLERDRGADDDFSLTSGSPAIDRGATLGSPRADIAGRSRHDDPAVANRGPADRYAATDLGAQPFDASGSGRTLVNGDDGAILVDLPFSFPLYRESHDRVAVSSNGFLQFGIDPNAFSPPETASEPLNSPRQLAAEPRIAPLFDDLDLTRTSEFGFDQARIFVDESTSGEITFRWAGAHAESGSEVNVAATLFDDGTFRFDYGAGNAGLSPTVGVSAGNGDQLALAPHDGASDLGDAASLRFDTAAGFVDLGAHEHGAPSADPWAPVFRVEPAVTNDSTPGLEGRIDDPRARIRVEIGNRPPAWVKGAGSLFGDHDWALRDHLWLDAPLPDGVYDVTVTATLGADTATAETFTDALTIDTRRPRVTVEPLVTSNGFPSVTGTVSESDAQVTGTIDGNRALSPIDRSSPTDNDLGEDDGTWRGAYESNFVNSPLSFGAHDVRITATDPAGNAGRDHSVNELIRANELDGLTVNDRDAADATPPLSGAAPASVAGIEVFVAGHGPFDASVAGDGTWSLGDDVIPPLPAGRHDVVLIARDGSGDQLGTDTTRDELLVPVTDTVPSAADDALATDEDTALDVPAPGLLDNDDDADGDELSVAAVNGRGADVGTPVILASGARLTLRADGSYVYDPNGAFESLGPVAQTTDSFTYTVADDDGNTDAATATVTIDGRAETRLRVTRLDAAADGFVLALSREPDLSRLELFGSGSPDLLVTGPDGSPVRGSLHFAAGTNELRFVAADGPLEAGADYAVSIPSRADGLVGLGGERIDGDGNGTAGGDYDASFTVPSRPEKTLAVPGFVRGPGQPANVPATARGVPVRIDDAAGVTSVSLSLSFDGGLLDVSDVVAAPDGWGMDAKQVGASALTVTASGPALSAGRAALVRVIAEVPGSATPGDEALLSLSAVTVDGSAAAGTAAVQRVGFFGDTDGDGRLTGFDASQLARTAVGLQNGFPTFGRTNPRLVGDVDGDGRFTGFDASLLARKAVGLSVEQIPDIPAAGTSPSTAGVRPASAERDGRAEILASAARVAGSLIGGPQEEAQPWRSPTIDLGPDGTVLRAGEEGADLGT